MTEPKVRGFLVEWAVNYPKNRDLIHRKIEKIEQDIDGFDIKVTFRDKTQLFLVTMKLADVGQIIHKFSAPDGYYGIVTFNMKENIDAVVKSWDTLAKFRNLSIYFINPWSSLDKKWIIQPYTHNMICEQDSLSTGLNSMAELVEFLTEHGIMERIK